MKIKPIRGWSLWVLLGVLCCCFQNVRALEVGDEDDAPAERVVEAEGIAPWGGNEEKARLAAVNQAKWTAVRKVLGKGVEHDQVNDYIKTYRVIGGGREGSQYVVRIAATVTPQADSKIEKKLLRWGGNPRIMVVIPETSFGRRIPDPAAETEIIRTLVKAKFRVLESSEIARFRESPELGRWIKQPDVPAMRRAGAKYQCDILIYGEAFSDTVDSPVNGYRAAEARVEAKAFLVDSGEILSADGDHASGTALSEAVAHKAALKNAGTLLGETLRDEIKEKITGENRVISLRLSRIQSATQLYNIQAALTKIAGVQSVQRRNLVLDRGIANLDVETTLLTDQFSRQLELIKNPRIKISSSTGQKIEASIFVN